MKLEYSDINRTTLDVAPFAGARIEISKIEIVGDEIMVAPFAGARIEILAL